MEMTLQEFPEREPLAIGGRGRAKWGASGLGRRTGTAAGIIFFRAGLCGARADGVQCNCRWTDLVDAMRLKNLPATHRWTRTEIGVVALEKAVDVQEANERDGV